MVTQTTDTAAAAAAVAATQKGKLSGNFVCFLFTFFINSIFPFQCHNKQPKQASKAEQSKANTQKENETSFGILGVEPTKVFHFFSSFSIYFPSASTFQLPPSSFRLSLQ